MARPIMESVSMLDELWYEKMNRNFAKLFDAPLPFSLLTKDGAGKFEQDPRVKKGCVGVFGLGLFISDGVEWTSTGREVLSYIADLNPATATVEDIKNAYNLLVNDLQVKGWMA